MFSVSITPVVRSSVRIPLARHQRDVVHNFLRAFVPSREYSFFRPVTYTHFIIPLQFLPSQALIYHLPKHVRLPGKGGRRHHPRHPDRLRKTRTPLDGLIRRRTGITPDSAHSP